LNYSNLTTGARGQALTFDGNNDYLNVNHNDSLILGMSVVTISAWAKPLTSGYGMILLKYGSSTGYAYYGGCGSGVEQALFIDGTRVDSNTYLTQNAWNHVVVVYNQTHAIFYLNGVFDGSPALAKGNVDYTTADLRIGINEAGTEPFNGLIDEVMVFNRTLSSTEILALYNSKVNKFNTSAMSLPGGQHNYTVYAIDEYGNSNNSGWRNFTIDSTPPTITFESPTPNNASSTTSPVTIVANISDVSNTSSWIDFDRTLVGYWAMDYYNATVIYDNSTYKNNGTFTGELIIVI